MEDWEGRPHSFVSAALFRLRGLHLQSLPLVRMSYPQFILRLCILDGEGLPSFYLRTVLIPGWAVAVARLAVRQPACGGGFDYPPEESAAAGGRWEVRRGRDRLALRAEPGSPAHGPGPGLGSWERTVAYFLRRRRGYFHSGSSLRKVEFPPRGPQPVPLAVELEEVRLVAECVAQPSGERWPALHSAWFCPEESFLFELGSVPARTVPRQLPAPG